MVALRDQSVKCHKQKKKSMAKGKWTALAGRIENQWKIKVKKQDKDGGNLSGYSGH